MRSAEMIEELEETASGAELNLGMGSLLGIFFGLALVCGVFFGFGYMMGHRGGGVYVPAEPLYESPKPATTTITPKPSAEIAAQPADATRVVVPNSQLVASSTLSSVAPDGPAPNSAAPISSAAAKTANLVSAPPATTVPATVSVTKPQPPTKVAALVTSPSAVLAQAPAAIQPAVASSASDPAYIVQIAAVKSRPDAEALAAALQKDGFNSAVRTEAQDKLLHVQVGPFASRDDAKAMRQKLSSAGYNAFIK